MRTVNVNDKVAMELKQIAEYRGESFDVVVGMLLERAVKDVKYRTQRNAQKWQEIKEMKKRIEELESKGSER